LLFYTLPKGTLTKAALLHNILRPCIKWR